MLGGGDPPGTPSLRQGQLGDVLVPQRRLRSLPTVPASHGEAQPRLPQLVPPAQAGKPIPGMASAAADQRCCVARTAPTDTPLTQHPSAAQGGPGNWEGESGGGTCGDGWGVLGCPLAMCCLAWPSQPCAMQHSHLVPKSWPRRFSRAMIPSMTQRPTLLFQLFFPKFLVWVSF